MFSEKKKTRGNELYQDQEYTGAIKSYQKYDFNNSNGAIVILCCIDLEDCRQFKVTWTR